METRKLTLAAMFIALNLALELIPSGPEALFNFGGFPLIVAGLVLGPAWGFAVGALSDLLGYPLHAHGAYFPGFTLTQALTGCLPALLLGRRSPTFLRLFFAIGLSQGLTKGVMVPWFRWIAFGHPVLLIALKGLLEQLFHVPLYAWGAEMLLRKLAAAGLLAAPRRDAPRGVGLSPPAGRLPEPAEPGP